MARSGVLGVTLAAAFGCGLGWAPVGPQTPSVVLTELATPMLPRQFGGWTMDGAATSTDAAKAEGVCAAVRSLYRAGEAGL